MFSGFWFVLHFFTFQYKVMQTNKNCSNLLTTKAITRIFLVQRLLCECFYQVPSSLQQSLSSWLGNTHFSKLPEVAKGSLTSLSHASLCCRCCPFSHREQFGYLFLLLLYFFPHSDTYLCLGMLRTFLNTVLPLR